MLGSRGEVGKRRREEIIAAASAIIAEKGLHKLSLSAIERRAGMSRGQLTYYFRTKEAILLAVFDHMMGLMCQRAEAGDGPPACALADVRGWQRVKAFLAIMVLHPPEVPDFHALQYTFLSQIGYRDDFRERLAGLYEQWRAHMAGDLSGDMAAARPAVSPRTVATFVQALLHGLAMQRVADPGSYDREEMLALCLGLLGPYFGEGSHSPPPPLAEGSPPRKRKRAKASEPPAPAPALIKIPSHSGPGGASRRRGPRSTSHGSDRNGQQ